MPRGASITPRLAALALSFALVAGACDSDREAEMLGAAETPTPTAASPRPPPTPAATPTPEATPDSAAPTPEPTAPPAPPSVTPASTPTPLPVTPASTPTPPPATPAPTPTPPPATPTPAPPPPEPEVRLSVIVDFVLETMTIPAGTVVRWRNDDAAPHTATGPDNEWNSGSLAQGQAYEHRFDRPGTFRYFCLLHPGMEGTITVQ